MRWYASSGMSEVLCAARAAINAQEAVIGKLRRIEVGLQQDLDSEMTDAGVQASEEHRTILSAALEACRERIGVEEMSLVKLRRLGQGLVADLAWRGARTEGSHDGAEPGAV